MANVPPEKSGTADQPPAYQVNDNYPPAPGFNQTQGMYPPNPGYPPQGYGSHGYGGQPYMAQGPYPGQPPVTVQPVYVAAVPLSQTFPDYLGYSIFTMLCCCFPLGIAALIYSINTREANLSGDGGKAERSSRMARTLNHSSLGIGIAIYVIIIIIYVIAATTAFSHH